jgi:hypothetical protein
LNNLNRGLGLADSYPFVLSPRVIEKLRFIHDTIYMRAEPAAAGGGATSAAPDDLAAGAVGSTPIAGAGARGTVVS